jgi:hypothetical protein
MKLTDKLIDNRYNNIVNRDSYGQKYIFDQRIKTLLPEFTEQEIKDFCKTSKKWNCSFYGGKIGTYYAITKKIKL